jgi:hypothetical protein
MYLSPVIYVDAWLVMASAVAGFIHGLAIIGY